MPPPSALRSSARPQGQWALSHTVPGMWLRLVQGRLGTSCHPPGHSQQSQGDPWSRAGEEGGVGLEGAVPLQGRAKRAPG